MVKKENEEKEEDTTRHDTTQHNSHDSRASGMSSRTYVQHTSGCQVVDTAQHSTAHHPPVSPHASSLATGATTTHPACCSAERCRSVRGCWYMLQCGYIHRPAEFDDSRQTSDDSRHSRMRHHMHDSIHMVKVMSKVHQIMGDDRLNII